MNQEKLLQSRKNNEDMINKMTKNIKPQIDEANEIAKSLAQEVQFDFKLTSGGSKDTMNLQEIETTHNEKYKLEI